MAPDDRQKSSRLIEQLFNDTYQFGFFQAVSLLEQHYPDAPTPGATGPLEEEVIRFRPHSGLGFPPTDACRIERNRTSRGKERVEVILSFMGLYGVASPLPTYIPESIATREDEMQALCAFLDIFNHRLYSLFYRSWKKYRDYLQLDSDGAENIQQRLKALLGLATAEPPDVPALRLVKYAGSAGNRTHCASGLCGLLTDYFDGVAVEVLEFMPRFVELRERAALGVTSDGPLWGAKPVQAKLGENVVLGQRVRDVSGKFRVVLGPLPLETYRTFLPDGENARTLHALIRFYAPDYLDFDLELKISTDTIPTPLQLGGELAQLSRTAWLGKPKEAAVSYEL